VITQEEASRRVARGLSWLLGPGEELGFDVMRIDVDTLDIDSPWSCVLGQAADNGWSIAYDYMLGRAGSFFSAAVSDLIQNGFADDSTILNSTWRKVIREEQLRRTATLILAA
jgi:hypothetical protein